MFLAAMMVSEGGAEHRLAITLVEAGNADSLFLSQAPDDQKLLFIHDDTTRYEVLLQAGIKKALGLIVKGLASPGVLPDNEEDRFGREVTTDKTTADASAATNDVMP